jgi:iron complex transport system substrate-binding protein
MKKNNPWVRPGRLYLFAGILFLLINACSIKQSKEPAVAIAITTAHYKPLKVIHAIGFNLVYKNGYKILYIFNHYQQEKDTIPYLLLPENAAVPDSCKSYRIIRTPVTKIITMSSTHVGLLDALHSLDAVVGHANASHLYNTTFAEHIRAGHIKEVGRDANLNVETVMALSPDAVMAVGMPGQSHSTYSVLEEAGIPVIYNAEWQETSLLARAEWLKVMAALLDKEALAEQKFNAIETTYDSLKQLAAHVSHKPLVMANTPVKGTWYVPGGRSYVANLIGDAGGDYHWKNNRETGSFVAPFEDAFEVGLKADVWINVQMSGPKENVPDLDVRLKDFKAFKTGQIYNFTQRVSDTEANDYWESGIVSPHLILADLIRIFHPELLPDYSLYYYKKVK